MHGVIGNTQSGQQFYRPELDVLRLLSFLLVFAHHQIPRSSHWFTGDLSEFARAAITITGNTFGFGLCLFFFLSAFLITTLLQREKQRTGAVHIVLFYQRRILRIFPLYFFAIMVGLVWAVITRVPSDFSLFGCYVVMLGNWCIGDRGWTDNPMTPLWSISIEEQFYLLWPLAIMALSERGLYVFSAVVVAASLSVAYYLGSAHANLDYGIWTNSFVQFLMFSAGTVTALSLRGKVPAWKASQRAMLCAGGVAVWLIAVVLFRCKLPGNAESGSDVAFGYSLIAFGCAAIFLAFYGIRCKLPSSLIYLGKISFGLYVFHLLSIRLIHLMTPDGPWLIHFSMALALTIVLASLSYRYLETPFLRLKRSKAVIRTGAV